MAGGLPSTEPRPQTAGVQDRIVVQPVHNQTLVSVRAGPRQGGRELPRGAQARLEVRGPSSQPAARPPPGFVFREVRAGSALPPLTPISAASVSQEPEAWDVGSPNPTP